MDEEKSLRAWYVIRVQSGREESVKTAVEKMVKLQELEKIIFQILVPIETIKKGNRTSKRNLYPGYIMIDMIKTSEIYYLLRTIPGLGELAGTMSQKEAEALLEQQHNKKSKSVCPFYKGQKNYDSTRYFC
jgi:transcriptional antiterminator NusG